MGECEGDRLEKKHYFTEDAHLPGVSFRKKRTRRGSCLLPSAAGLKGETELLHGMLHLGLAFYCLRTRGLCNKSVITIRVLITRSGALVITKSE